MKSLKIILLITISVISNYSSAQEFYIIGGTNISTLSQSKSNDYVKSRDKQLGFQIGAIYDYKISKNFSFSPQALFSLKRERIVEEVIIEFPQEITTLKNESQLNEYYIDIPINFKYSIPIKKFNLNILAGPFLNLELFNKNTSVSNNTQEVNQPGFSITEKFINRVDYGFNVGLGFDYKSFLLNVSTDFGFFREMKYEEFVFDNKIKNSVLKISLGYKI